MRPREVGRAAARRPRHLDSRDRHQDRGGDAIRCKGGDRTSRVEFKRQTTNTEGETKLHGVKIIVDNREGRNYVVTGKEAFIGKQNSSFDVRGDVKLETSDGLTANGQQATYADAEKIVRVPGAGQVHARPHERAPASGSPTTSSATRCGSSTRPTCKFAAESTAGPMAFTAGAFGYARRDRYMRFERTMHMDREGQLIDANESTVRLFPDRDETDYVELRGGAKVTGGPTARRCAR